MTNKHKLTGQGGKGSAPRKVDKTKFDENFERVFGKKEPKKEEKK